MRPVPLFDPLDGSGVEPFRRVLEQHSRISTSSFLKTPVTVGAPRASGWLVPRTHNSDLRVQWRVAAVVSPVVVSPARLREEYITLHVWHDRERVHHRRVFHAYEYREGT